MNKPWLLFPVIGATITAFAAEPTAKLRFEVLAEERLGVEAPGRVFVILSHTNQPEPRLTLGRPGSDAPEALARDAPRFKANEPVVLDTTAFSFPAMNLAAISPGDYFVQAVFDHNRDLRSPNSPGNLYSRPEKMQIEPMKESVIKIKLTEQIPAEKLPEETDLIKFVKLESKLLSEFYRRPIFLRAGIILPRDYEKEPSRGYPLWIRIGGLNTRFHIVQRMMSDQSPFKKVWMADQTPRFIVVQLDGAGPHGDPYYVNSANNGPYGDALIKELLPHVESRFRAVSGPTRRVLSGTSTGGWVSLALQIFYPDEFNGAWSSCPDPVDFRALQLVNIYEDRNAFVDRDGKERPSSRDLQGRVAVTMREEVSLENLLGRDNCFTTSGEQWGAWTASFSSRGSDGLPTPAWDPISGIIDRTAVEHWKKYDLRLHLEKNWSALAPRLRGKLHIASGEADQYYLNNAVHMLDRFLAGAKPSIEAKIVFGAGEGHGWFDLSLEELLKEMEAAVKSGNR